MGLQNWSAKGLCVFVYVSVCMYVCVLGGGGVSESVTAKENGIKNTAKNC